MKLFTPRKKPQSNHYQGMSILRFIVYCFIGGVASTMVIGAFDADPKPSKETLDEIRAQRIIDEARDESFRNCIRDAAGQVGVATMAQTDKCKRHYLGQ